MKTTAYLRVSRDSQDVKNQRLALLEFAQKEQLVISEFMELNMSSRRSSKERQIDLLMDKLVEGDTLVVSELSRMGRSVGEEISIVDALVKRQVQLVSIKEGIRLKQSQALQSKVMVTLFSLFAEIERSLISLRTKEGLAAARASGQRLGLPGGKLGSSKLDGKQLEDAEEDLTTCSLLPNSSLPYTAEASSTFPTNLLTSVCWIFLASTCP